jgi:gliding motility-associated-like protein
LAGKGYQQLIIITKEMLNGRYIFKDTTVQPGKTYCYRVLAKFAKISSGGYPYNIVESLPSKEICAQLPRSLPIITRVSVINTDATNGQIDLRWSKPIATDLDTVLNPPPYRYRIFRQSGLNISSPPTGNPIYDQSFNQLWLSDTTFIDQGVNTIATGHAYLIEFSTASSSMPMGYSPSASSVYLSIVSTDQTNKLSWQAKVPWQNQSFDIYMKPPGQIQFDSLTTVQVPQYQHTNLDNGAEYCYYIKTIGTYSIPGVIDPIINLSQEACGVPIDTIAPCSPELSLVNICIDSTISAEPPFFNYLRWTNPNIACLGSNDTYRYNIYFAPDSSTDLTLLATLEGAENTSFDHEVTVTLAGCYSVTAIDTVGNESPKTVRICTDNCPLYALPNVFTPNGDGKNDVFKPFPGYRFVSSIEMQILNRWGNIVFETTNPDINWDGRDQSGKMLSSGTYFYICKAYAQAIDGIIALPGLFSGYIELLGGQ